MDGFFKFQCDICKDCHFFSEDNSYNRRDSCRNYPVGDYLDLYPVTNEKKALDEMVTKKKGG